MRELKDPCRFYSLLMPIKQQDALRAYSHKNRVPVSVCVRAAIDLFLENAKCKRAVANFLDEGAEGGHKTNS